MANYLGVQQPTTDYMTFDVNNNVYNYKNLIEKQQIYQQYQNMNYFTHIKPIVPEDPGNLPCDIRPTYLTLNYNNRQNMQQTVDNNPNYFYYNIPAKPGYYKTFNDTNHNKLNNIRPQSILPLAFETSKQDYHGFIIEK